MKKLINGKFLANLIIGRLKERKKLKFKPELVIIKTKHTKEIDIFINAKKKVAKKLDILCRIFDVSSNPSKKEILQIIKKANQSKKVLGIIYQFPATSKINPSLVINKISPLKDVDGFCDENLKRLFLDKSPFHVSPTAQAIEYVFRYLKRRKKEKLKNKICTILSKRSILTSVIIKLLSKYFRFLIITDLKEKKWKEKVKLADVLITCIDKPKIIKAEHIKRNSILIDIGTIWENEKLIGNIDIKDVYKKIKYITPVPGGIGPLTVAFLFKNLINGYIRNYE